MPLGINTKKTLASTLNIVFNKALQTKPQPYGATFKGEIDMKDILGACILGAILGAMFALSI